MADSWYARQSLEKEKAWNAETFFRTTGNQAVRPLFWEPGPSVARTGLILDVKCTQGVCRPCSWAPKLPSRRSWRDFRISESNISREHHHSYIPPGSKNKAYRQWVPRNLGDPTASAWKSRMEEPVITSRPVPDSSVREQRTNIQTTSGIRRRRKRSRGQTLGDPSKAGNLTVIIGSHYTNADISALGRIYHFMAHFLH